MSKEIYISSTPHETRLAIVENDELTEIYYERENEYTLAGSIYNGRVTRVLPGMQSSFVDIGLERDAFLYITDFMEEAGDSADFDHGDGQRAPRTLEGQRPEAQRDGQRGDGQRNGRGDRGDRGNDRGGERSPAYVSERSQEQASATPASDFAVASEGRGDEFGNRNDRGGRGRNRGRRDRGGDRQPSDRNGAVETQRFATPVTEGADEFEEMPTAPVSFEAQPEAPVVEAGVVGEGAPGADGSRRWRGRRGRRRGRGTGQRPEGQVAGAPVAPVAGEQEFSEPIGADDEFGEVQSFDIDGSAEVASEPVAPVAPVAAVDPMQQGDRGRRDRGDRQDRGGRDGRNDRGGRGERTPSAPPRVPRGFAPRGLYAVDSPADVEETLPEVSASAEAAPAVEPLILPGESLSKYRKGGEATPALKASAASSALPDSGIVITGWDGGAALPGETLSRHRGGSAPASSASEGRGGDRADFRRPDGGRGDRDRDRGGRGGRNDQRGERDQRFDGRRDGRSEHRDALPAAQTADQTTPAAPMTVPSKVPGRDLQSAGPVSGYAHMDQGSEEIWSQRPDFNHSTLPEPTAEAPHAGNAGSGSLIGNESDKASEYVDAAQTHEAPEPEYEPSEASASYRVDPAPPSEYRQSAPAAPEVEEPIEEEIEQHHHQDLEIAPSGEVFAANGRFGQHGGQLESISAYADSIEPPTEFHPGAAVHDEPVEHDVTVVEPTGEMLSEEPVSTFYAAEVEHSPEIEEFEEAAEVVETPRSGSHLLPFGVPMTPAVYGDVERGQDGPHQFEASAGVQAEPAAYQPVVQHFEPGLGDLEEDFIDEEEELETHSFHARAAELEEAEEQEPLEGAADLGTMIREMTIDHITRTDGAVSEEEDGDEDFEEDTLEEDEFEEEGFETQGADEGSEDAEESRVYGESEQTREEHGFSGDPEFHETPDSDPSYVVGGVTPAAATEGSSFANGNGDPRRRREGGRRGDRRGGRDRGGNREGAPRSEVRSDSGYRSESSSNGYADRNGGSDRGGLGERARNTGGSGDRDRGRGNGGRGGRQSAQMTNLPAISELLKPGQEILCQIAKEPIAKKGARITSHIALPGRFLVFMPTVSHTGVSRKIESDGERRRLKEILLSEKGEAAGGFIVRTAAAGASEEELRSDLRFLLNLWADIKQRSESSKSPALIYHDLNLVERILRDQVTDTFSAIWVDTETEYERVLRFLQRFQPSLIRRVKLYTKETPLFEQFGITEEINKALRSKVWLKSGGSIVINQTEALVAIDINTGKFVGKTARLEDTIVKTNLDAIPEIVRQIRLRDLGGIIIIDFIDMDERKNRNRVMAALEEELKNDRAPSKVLPFNDFGLVAITRKRVKQSLERTLSTTCNVCTGTGMVKSPVSVCNDIYIEMRKMHKHLDRGDVMLRVHPEVVKQLKMTGSKWLQEMEEMCGKTILIKSDPSLHPEQFDIH